jgi:acetylornithine deacetylase/succinyl-diaminopimelate desuccinylase-like protein
MNETLAVIDAERDRFVEELKQFLRIPSISTDPERAGDVRKASDWILAHFRSLGLRAEQFETERHPVVYAEWLGAPGKPTVMFYGHCDVQPVDPIDEWQTPPFEPVEKNGNIHARGSSDDKGQAFTHVKAVESWLRARGSLPVNVKFLMEAEEEIGSPNLPKWLADHTDLAAADLVVISDTTQFGPGLPSVCTGLRGIAALEVHVKTAESDLHSGTWGGAVPNAIEVLTRILAGLHDAEGLVTVPGFYDAVAEPSDAEKTSWAALPHSDADFLAASGAKALHGEPGRGSLERTWARPTLEIIGIGGGYQGAGHKGVVPCRAFAKLSVRLVPDQAPTDVIAAVRAHIEALAPGFAEIEIKSGHGSPPVSIPTDSKWVAAAARALERGFGRQPVYIREGGSISIVTRFVKEYGIPVLLLGFGLPDDRIHGPNEKFSLADFQAGIRTSAALLDELGRGA